MTWLKGIVGVICTLLGLVWIAQGTNVMPGSPVMSGHAEWAVIGLLVLALGAWLLWSVVRARRPLGTTP